MIKYLLYLILLFSVIKMYRYRLKADENIIYASISIFVGILIINWLVPKTFIENFTNRKKDPK